MQEVPKFLPGRPLPSDLDRVTEGDLFHHVTPSGVAISVRREGSTWAWRTLRYGDDDGHGEGGREQFKTWLAKR